MLKVLYCDRPTSYIAIWTIGIFKPKRNIHKVHPLGCSPGVFSFFYRLITINFCLFVHLQGAYSAACKSILLIWYFIVYTLHTQMKYHTTRSCYAMHNALIRVQKGPINKSHTIDCMWAWIKRDDSMEKNEKEKDYIASITNICDLMRSFFISSWTSHNLGEKYKNIIIIKIDALGYLCKVVRDRSQN